MNKWKTISKNAISFVLGIIFATCSIVLAETCQTTLSSSNVIYGDTTVQAETTELITQAGNLNSRVTTLEGKDYAKRLTGEKVTTWTDSEGGNLRIVSKNGTYFSEMDMYNDTTWRIYHATSNGSPTGGIYHSYNKTANLDYLDGVTSNIQTQLNGKAASGGYTANRVLITGSDGKIATTNGLDSTELGMLDGVTSNIQTQLNNKMPKVIGNLELNPGTSAGHGGYIDFHHNNSSSDYTSRIIADSSGQINLVASNGVKVNGTKIGDIIKLKQVTIQKANLSTNMNMSSYVSLDSGYKFLAWYNLGNSNGWVANFPIYVSNPTSTTGYPWWNGTISGAVDFYYLEIRNS